MNVIMKNNDSFLSKQELEYLLKLLDDSHSESVHKLTLFHNELDVIRNFKVKFKVLLQILRGKFMGFESEGNIYLFPFLLKHFKVGNDDKKLLLTHILFHEVRHAYQNNHLKDNGPGNPYNLMSENYSEQWAEKDANEYAYQMIKENRNQILTVLGVTESDLFKK